MKCNECREIGEFKGMNRNLYKLTADAIEFKHKCKVNKTTEIESEQ